MRTAPIRRRVRSRIASPASRTNCLGSTLPKRLPSPPARTRAWICMRASAPSTVVTRHRVAPGDRSGRPPRGAMIRRHAPTPRRMNRLLRVARTLVTRLGFVVGSLRPPRRRVVLATSHAAGLGGNLAWIRDELARHHPPIPVVELAPGERRSRLDYLSLAFRAGYQLASARVFV